MRSALSVGLLGSGLLSRLSWIVTQYPTELAKVQAEIDRQEMDLSELQTSAQARYYQKTNLECLSTVEQKQAAQSSYLRDLAG